MKYEAASQKRWLDTHIHECACGFGENYMRWHVDWDADDLEMGQPTWYVEIVTTGGRLWRERIKMAWRVLRGRQDDVGLLLDKIDIRQIRDGLTRFLVEIGEEVSIPTVWIGMDGTNVPYKMTTTSTGPFEEGL